MSAAEVQATGSAQPGSDSAAERERTTVLFVVGVSTLLTTLGMSGITLALPAIGREFGLTIGQTRWVMLAFLLASSSVMLVAGRLGDLFGLRKVFLVGFWVIALASLLCGLAPVFPALAAARALHGIGGALVMAAGPALLTTNFPPQQRGRVLGTVSTATYAGLTAGPIIGGLLVTWVSWRGVFLVNVPFSALVLVLAHRHLPSPTPREGGKMDVPGAVLLLAGLPLLMLPLAMGGREAPSWLPLVGIAGFLLVAAFTLVELRAAHPLLDPRLFRNREFTGSVAAALFNYIALFILILLMPFYFEEGRGLDASHAGLLMTAQPAMMALVAFSAGRASDRLGTRNLCITGMAVMAAGLAALSTLGPDSPLLLAGLFLALAGLGTGIFISPNSSSLMGAATRHQQGVASAVLAVSRNLGMLIGTATGAGIFLLAGGQSGNLWATPDYSAFHVALRVAAGAATAAALCSVFRQRKR
jgi:EmrB/QacA subfamily drug resistance transporter